MIGLLYFFEVLFVLICVFLVLLILIQKGRGGGLASAFGGAGGQTAFGSKTGDVLTWATSVVFAVFLTLAVVLNLIANQIDKSHGAHASTVALSPADRSTLPKPLAAEPGIHDSDQIPTTPVSPSAAPAMGAAAAAQMQQTPTPAPSPAPISTAAPTTAPSVPMNLPTTLP